MIKGCTYAGFDTTCMMCDKLFKLSRALFILREGPLHSRRVKTFVKYVDCRLFTGHRSPMHSHLREHNGNNSFVLYRKYVDVHTMSQMKEMSKRPSA